MSHLQAAVLCDEAVSSSTPFAFWEEKGRYVLKDEKKYGAVDESISEQQFCKSDAITFVV